MLCCVVLVVARERKRKRFRFRREKGERDNQKMSVAAYLARRAAQKERVRILYRRALKDTLNWAVHRHLFYDDVSSSPSPFTSIFSLLHSIHPSFISLTILSLYLPGFKPPRKVRAKQTRGSFLSLSLSFP